MKLSTKVLYSVKFMIDLSLNGSRSLVFLKDISRRQGISEKYLGHFVPLLKSAGLIYTTRGASGGFSLTRNAREITLKDIIEAVDGPLCLTGCVKGLAVCKKAGACMSGDVWGQATNSISGIFASFTLHQMAEEQRSQQEELAYDI